jgi:DUF2075 family protein
MKLSFHRRDTEISQSFAEKNQAHAETQKREVERWRERVNPLRNSALALRLCGESSSYVLFRSLHPVRK